LAKTAANSENQFHLHERVFLFWGTLPQDQSFCIHWLVSEENNNKTIQISPFEYCIKNVFCCFLIIHSQNEMHQKPQWSIGSVL